MGVKSRSIDNRPIESGALGQSDTGIGDDQPHAFEPRFVEMFEECAPDRLVLLGALADAENLSIPSLFTPIATDSDTLRTSPAQLRLSTMPSR